MTRMPFYSSVMPISMPTVEQFDQHAGLAKRTHAFQVSWSNRNVAILWGRTGVLLLLFALLLMSGCQSTGCCETSGCGRSCGPMICLETCRYFRCLDGIQTRWSAKCCARRALRNVADTDCDYRRGFKQAYVDIAQGSTGEVPPVPPQRYWTVCFRSCGGHARAEQWFEGYADGVEKARCLLRSGPIASSGTYYSAGPGELEQGIGATGHALSPRACEVQGW